MKHNRPKLIVHIGGAKAGSTSIQDCLFVNREPLSEFGFVVPNTELELSEGRADQVWFFESLYQDNNAESLLLDKLDAVCAKYSQKTGAPPRAVVLSAENLSNHTEPSRLFSRVLNRFDVQVVLYVRRQEDAYQAAWQQWFSKTGIHLEEWINNTNGYFCDWQAIATRWERVAPDKLFIRVLDDELLAGGNVVSDFCSLFLPKEAVLRASKLDMNISFGVHISHLYSSLHGVFSNEHDTRLDTLLYEYDILSAKRVSNEWIFNRRQIDIIRNRHSIGNAILKQVYFNHLDRNELFPPIPVSAKLGVSHEEVNRRNIAVLAELVLKVLLKKEF